MFHVLALTRQLFRRHGDSHEEQTDERTGDGGTGSEFVEILGDHSLKLLRCGRATIGHGNLGKARRSSVSGPL